MFTLMYGDVCSDRWFCTWDRTLNTVALFEVQPAALPVALALGPRGRALPKELFGFIGEQVFGPTF